MSVFFPKLSDGYQNSKLYQKNGSWQFGKIDVVVNFIICNIEKCTFFSVSLVVNHRRLRAFILQKVVERQKKKFCYPSLNFGKEDTHMILLSA